MRLRSGQSCSSSQNSEKHSFINDGLCNVILKTRKGFPHTVTSSTTQNIGQVSRSFSGETKLVSSVCVYEIKHSALYRSWNWSITCWYWLPILTKVFYWIFEISQLHVLIQIPRSDWLKFSYYFLTHVYKSVKLMLCIQFLQLLLFNTARVPFKMPLWLIKHDRVPSRAPLPWTKWGALLSL